MEKENEKPSLEYTEAKKIEVKRSPDGSVSITVDGGAAVRVGYCEEVHVVDVRDMRAIPDKEWEDTKIEAGDFPYDADWQRAERYGGPDEDSDAEAGAVSSAGTVLIDGGDPRENIGIVVGVHEGRLTAEDISDDHVWAKAPAYILVEHRDGSRRLDRVDAKGARRQVCWIPKPRGGNIGEATANQVLADAYQESVKLDAFLAPKSSK